MQLFKKKRNKGFTLVELVVVILVIAVLATATFLGGATIIKQARLLKIKTNLSNYSTFAQDMMYTNPSLQSNDEKYSSECTTLDSEGKVVVLNGEEDKNTKVLDMFNEKYLTDDFKLSDGENPGYKDIWGIPYTYSYAINPADESTQSGYACVVINSAGANHINESENLAEELITNYSLYKSAEDAASNISVGDDCCIIIWMCNGSVSIAYNDIVEIKNKKISSGGLYKTGTNEFQKITINDEEVDATWDNLKLAYPDAITETAIVGDVTNEASYFPATLAGDLVIPDEITSIGMYAFRKCAALTSVKIPENITTIEEETFYKCSNLKEIKIPNKVTIIKDSAFVYCENATSIILPEKLEIIKNNAFYGCYKINSVTIPKTTSIIGYSVFGNCSNLLAINVNKYNQNYSSGDGVLFNKDKTILIQYPAGKVNENYTVSKNITKIETSAFEGCKNLKSIIINDGIEEIESYTFKYCSNLINVTIPLSVEKIGGYAFTHCKSLEEITIPNSVTTIKSTVFNDSENLKKIYYNGTATGAPWGAENAIIIP